jgi:hypothetical protein
MKATVLILTCLVVLAASEWAELDFEVEVEENQISERTYALMTDAQNKCIDNKRRVFNSMLERRLTNCYRDKRNDLKLLNACIKKIALLRSCF